MTTTGFDWLANGREAIWLVVIGASITAIAALGFTLGGLWALRGRAALRAPRCRRCATIVRGAGRALPAACPERGLDLAGRGAVRWLRFRRQPLTLLITAPIVSIGGFLLAAVPIGMLAWSITQDLEVRRTAHVVQRRLDELAAEATPKEIDVATLLERAHRGDVEELNAFGLRVMTYDVKLSASDAALLKSFVVELFGKLGDDLTWVTNLSREELDRVADNIATGLVRQKFVEQSWHDERVSSVVESLRAELPCAIPPQVRPGSTVNVIFAARPGVSVQVTSITIDGGGARLGAPFGVVGFRAPGQVGDYDVEVHWTEHFNRLGALPTQAETSRDRAQQLTLRVRDEHERLPPRVDAEHDPFTDPASGVQVWVKSVGGRDLVTLGAMQTNTALIGKWSAKFADRWVPITNGVVNVSDIGAVMTLIARPADGWGPELTLRFEPAPEEEMLLPFDFTMLGWRAWRQQHSRTFDGAWAAPRDVTAKVSRGETPSVPIAPTIYPRMYKWSYVRDEVMAKPSKRAIDK